MNITYHETKLTRHTRADVTRQLEGIAEFPGAHTCIDMVDPQGEVGHVCLYRDEAGNYFCRKGTPDPRNLYAKLTRSLRLKTLRLAVAPEASL
jgi:hypothetical protein